MSLEARRVMQKGKQRYAVKFVVVMPFNASFDPVYSVIKSAVAEATLQTGSTCLRVDEDLKAGRITGKIDDHLRSADIGIADITGLNSNVMWEIGFIEALHKPLLVLSQSTADLPFNIKDIPVIRYDLNLLESTLHTPLVRSIEQTITIEKALRSKLTIAITGSRNVMSHKAEYSIRTWASPFLSPDTTWYCGTNGPVDEAAARFLFDAKQHVIGVYYSTGNVSAETQSVFAKHGAPLVDADLVPLQRTMAGLNSRDAFFVANADLVILIWDGQSKNTGDFLTWLSTHKKDHMLGFA